MQVCLFWNETKWTSEQYFLFNTYGFFPEIWTMPGTFATATLVDNGIGVFGYLHTGKEIYSLSVTSPYADVFIYADLL